MDSLNLLCIQAVLVLRCDGIHHFHQAQIIPDIRIPLFEPVSYPKRCIVLMVRMATILCMVQRNALGCKPICLDNRHHIDIRVLQQHAVKLRNTKVDFRLANYRGTCNWLHDFGQSKLHSVHTVMNVRMDLCNDYGNKHDRQGIHSLNYIQFVHIVRMDFLCIRTSNGMLFDVSRQSIQHSLHMDQIKHMD